MMSIPVISTRSGADAVNSKPTSRMIEVLTPIWQRVLQKSSIDIEDNFFDVGGSLLLADMLFAEITQKCGRELPSSTICHAPTITALASLLEQPTLPRFSPLVPMKAGHKIPPVLMVHGLAGSLEFFELGRHIRTEHPIYGFQAKGVDGMEEPLQSVEDMARLYLDALKELQAHGPYILMGYSIGGLVALEMAQRILEDGENVALLVLVDTYPHPRYLSSGQRLQLMAQRLRRHILRVKQLSIGDSISYLVRGAERRLHLFGVYSRSGRFPGTSRLSFAQTTSHIMPKAYVALGAYRPQFYRGKIKFVKAADDSFFPEDPSLVWGKLATELEIENVPGDHDDVVTTHFETLASVLSRYLREALGEE